MLADPEVGLISVAMILSAVVLKIGLRKLKFDSEAKSILSKWKITPLVSRTKPIAEYHYAYPEDLMEEVGDLLLRGLRDAGFSVVSPEKLGKDNQEDIIDSLNEAWERFWGNPEMFRNWEEKTIRKFKSKLVK